MKPSAVMRIIVFSLFVFTLAVYIFFSLLLVPPNAEKDRRRYLLTGDEPHYLLITHSLVFDNDFNLYNNVENGDSLVFFDRVINGFSGGLELFGPYARGSKITAKEAYWVNKRYSNLNLGLPLILSPFYSLGILWNNQIRLCIVLFISILAAFLVVNIFLLSYKVSGSKFFSLFATVCASLSMPIVFYSRQVYPDLPASLLLVYGFRKIYEGELNDICKILLISLCISFLPWLHEKYILLAFLMLIFFARKTREQKYDKRLLIVFFIPLLASIVLQMRYYYIMFGVPYPVNMHPGFFISEFFRGAFGLLFDEAHGLIPYSPIYVLSIAGIVLYAGKKENNAFWLLIFPVSIFFATACFKEWWGGFCPPGRYLIPAISFLVPFTAYILYKINSRIFRSIGIILGLIGIWVGLYGMFVPGCLYAHRHPFMPYGRITAYINSHFQNFR